MTFMEHFGGHWTFKSGGPSTEAMENQEKLIEKLKVSEEYLEKLEEHFEKGGKPKVSEVKDLGGGVYVLSVMMGALSHEIRFTLDGKPSQNIAIINKRPLECRCTFENGVWRARLDMEGCPEVIVERRRVGDEIHVSGICDGLTWEEIDTLSSATDS